MDDNSENDAQGNVHPVSILNLPNETFEFICSFLDTSTLMNLCLVCTKFNSIIKNEISLKKWEKRAQYIWPDAVYPILRPGNPDRLFWRISCVALQKQKALCTQNAHPLVRIYSETIDMMEKVIHPLSSLLLIHKHDNIAYIAAKGRNLLYKKINFEHRGVYVKKAHWSQISGLTILNDKIYSCSITTNRPIKSWEFINGNIQMETHYNFDLRWCAEYPTCLSSYPGQNVFAVGSNYGYVNVFDSRLRDHVDRYEIREKHRSTYISTLAMNSKYILSANYDDKVFAYDQRNKQIKETKIPETVTCIKMQEDCVLIGDGVGKLHVLNPRNNFELENSYDIGHTCGIKGVHLTYGNLITSSTSEIIISSPTNPPRHMYTLDIPHIRSMDYQNGTLALSNNDNRILIYQFVQ